jgi:hypothetical protein
MTRLLQKSELERCAHSKGEHFSLSRPGLLQKGEGVTLRSAHGAKAKVHRQERVLENRRRRRCYLRARLNFIKGKIFRRRAIHINKKVRLGSLGG